MPGKLQQDVAAPSEGETRRSNRLAKAKWGIVWIALLAGLFYHILRSVDPSLLYYGDLVMVPSNSFLTLPLFERGWAFFASLAGRPGGLTEWAGAYLGQLFIIPYLGAAILTAVAVALFVAINSIVSQMARTRTRVAGVVGVAVLGFIWNHYEFNLADCLAVTAALGAASVVIRLRRAALRDVSMVVGGLGLYYVLGAPAMLFAAVCGLHECWVARRYVSAAGWLLVGAGAPMLIGVAALSLPMGESYIRLTGVAPYGEFSAVAIIPTVFWAWVGLYVLPIVAMMLAGLCRWRLTRAGDHPNWAGLVRIKAATLMVVIALGVAAIHRTVDSEARWVLRLHSLASQDAWAELLVAAEGYQEMRLSAQLGRHINRALFETGKLGSKMFAYPQIVDGLVIQPLMPGVSAEGPETLLQLGLVNQAEHTASRLLELWGPRPSTLKVLARIFIVKNEPDVARIFLRRLERNVIWGDWASQTLEDLDADPSLAKDADIARIRRLRSNSRDYAPADVRASLIMLLQEQPANRMAFEYSVAAHLAARRVGMVVSLLRQFGDKQGYAVLPEYHAEAVAVFIVQTSQDPGLGDLMPSLRAIGRARRAFEIAGGPGAASAFAREMPNSYYRFLFRRRPND